MWTRASSASSGSTVIGGGAGATRAGGGTSRMGAFSSGARNSADAGDSGGGGRAKSAAAIVTAVASFRTDVTMNSRVGGFSTGRIDAATNAASRLDSPKNRGSTSCAFFGVSTFASSITEERHRSPALSAVSTSGYFRTSSAAVFRYWAAPAESFSSRRRNEKRLEYPSDSHIRLRSKSARATRKSPIAACSRRRRSARREVSSRAVFMHASSHRISTSPQTHAFAFWREIASGEGGRHSFTPGGALAAPARARRDPGARRRRASHLRVKQRQEINWGVRPRASRRARP